MERVALGVLGALGALVFKHLLSILFGQIALRPAFGLGLPDFLIRIIPYRPTGALNHRRTFDFPKFVAELGGALEF